MLKPNNEPFQTVVGRPIDPEWTMEFYNLTRSVLPVGISLTMRKMPGLVYVSGPELQRLGVIDYEARDEDERRQHLQAYISSLVTDLSGRKDLDSQSITSDIALPLSTDMQIKLKHDAKKKATIIGINIDDRQSSSQQESYIIKEEKDAIANELKIRSHAQSIRKLPRHHAVVGVIRGSLEPHTTEQIVSLLKDPVPFLKIGVVSVGMVSVESSVLSAQDFERMIKQVPMRRHNGGFGKPKNRGRRY